jgi:hypothetical protein
MAEVAFDAQQTVGIDAIQLDDLAGSGFEEVAVVADGDGGEGGTAQQFFKPLDAGQVEVVGGLVEQHHLRLDDHGFGDGQPLAPAAGERGRLLIEVGKTGAAGEFAQRPSRSDSLTWAADRAFSSTWRMVRPAAKRESCGT